MAVALYRLLSKGTPVPLKRVADAVSLPEATVEATIPKWPLFRDDHGAVIGFGGLTVAEMPPHHFTIDGRTLYTWCAWDSLFIPGILGKTAAVESVCPVTKARISLEVGPEGIRNVAPPTVVVSFLAPDRTFDRNVIVNFCHFVYFFRDTEAAEAWLSRHPGTFLLSLDEAFTLGQVTNARNFGHALGLGDRR
ncbi:MAG: organomercurial lyase [Armatimonadota bacterium]|nr:organomercurial lyase [Armatimonadota bacterium]MDR7576303.1 organomercurial lyase [Armatimonadota bacterium]